MYIDLMGKGVRVICNPNETGRPTSYAPHDMEGTVLSVRVTSTRTANRIREGKLLEVLTKTNNSADIVVRWDSDVRVTLWPGALIIRDSGSISSCTSIWGGEDTINFDTRAFAALQPKSCRPAAKALRWTPPQPNIANIATASITKAIPGIRHYTKYPDEESVPVGHTNAVIEGSDGRVYNVRKGIDGRSKFTSLNTPPGVEVVITDYGEGEKMRRRAKPGIITHSYGNIDSSKKINKKYKTIKDLANKLIQEEELKPYINQPQGTINAIKADHGFEAVYTEVVNNLEPILNEINTDWKPRSSD